MKNSNLYSKKFILHIILFSIIAASALNYWYVAEYALNGHWHPYYYQQSNYINLVPSWQKILKDIFVIILLLFSLIWHPSSKKFREDKMLIVSYILCLFIFGIAWIKNIDSNLNFFVIIASIRPIIFVISLFIFCHRHLSHQYLLKVLEWVNALAVIQFFYAFLQRQAAVTNNSISWLSNGNIRSVGTFVGPNTLGLFLALCIYINLYILPLHKWRYFLVASYIIGIFFSGSRTSVLIVGLILAEKLARKISKSAKIVNKNNFVFLLNFSWLLPFFIYLLYQIRDFSSRGGANTSIYGGRLEIFLEYIQNIDVLSILLGNHLGYGSNSIIIYQKQTDLNYYANGQISFIADSTWTYVIAQFGLFGLFLFLMVFYHLWKTPHRFRFMQYSSRLFLDISIPRMGFLIYCFASSITIILFEYYAVLPIIIALLFDLRFSHLPAKPEPIKIQRNKNTLTYGDFWQN